MTAVTPKAPNHANLPPLASRFVDVAALPWERTLHPGCETKTLVVDRASGLLTMLLRMAPGAKLPDHEHVLVEQTYVLEGTNPPGPMRRPAHPRSRTAGGLLPPTTR